ncbi:MAG: class I SAM-dependent methyltransferase, partial [Actinomycetota bacterium]|nr:class I SAM-dependent methyltransferase [Actinomycetota bacterium]
DVSPTMLQKMKEECDSVGVRNVFGLQPDEPWDKGAYADLVYSYWVFQHIESFAEISQYIERIARCLRQHGIAYLQFDTRPATTAYRIRNRLPDAMLPRPWRRGIRRLRRPRPALLSLFARNELLLVHEEGCNSENNIFVLQRA